MSNVGWVHSREVVGGRLLLRLGGGQATPLVSVQEWLCANPGLGLTVSGTEPLAQADFTRGVLRAAKAAGRHTALNTGGGRAEAGLLDATDLVLLDLLAGTDATQRALTGRPLGPALAFARGLRQPLWIRYVLVPGHNDGVDEIEAFSASVAELQVQRVQILPVQQLRAGSPALAVPAIPELVAAAAHRMRNAGLPVR